MIISATAHAGIAAGPRRAPANAAPERRPPPKAEVMHDKTYQHARHADVNDAPRHARKTHADKVEAADATPRLEEPSRLESLPIRQAIMPFFQAGRLAPPQSANRIAIYRRHDARGRLKIAQSRARAFITAEVTGLSASPP